MERIKDANIEVSPLKYIYMLKKDKVMSEMEAEEDDITDVFWEDIDSRLEHKQLVNIAVRGEVAEGKSTGASAILDYTSVKLGVRGELNRFIFMDSIEFLRWIKGGQRNVMIQIDENNKMQKTGYNATIEGTLYEYYSDVMAQFYIHRVTCSPDTVIDSNAYLILDLEGKDMKSKITRFKVSYRDITRGGMPCVIGHVDIYVGEVIEKRWYKSYREKKEKRMKLLEDEGITDIREMEFAVLTLKTYCDLKDVADVKKLSNDTIFSVVNIKRREEGRVYSMLTMQEIVSKTKNLLGLKYDIGILKRKREKGGLADTSTTLALSKLNSKLAQCVAEETRLQDVYNKYMKIK